MKLVFIFFLLIVSLATLAAPCDRFAESLPPESYFKKQDKLLEGERPVLAGTSTNVLIKNELAAFKALQKKLISENVSSLQGKLDETYDAITIKMNQAAGKGDGYYVMPMAKYHLGENSVEMRGPGAVNYLSESERFKYKVTIKDGLFYDFEGKLLTTKTEYTGDIFVMDRDGSFYVIPESWKTGNWSYQHSSLLEGLPVASPGEMKVVNGELKTLSDKSGHYRPLPIFLKQALAEMVSKKVDLKNVEIDRWSRDSEETLEELRKLGFDK